MVVQFPEVRRLEEEFGRVERNSFRFEQENLEIPVCRRRFEVDNQEKSGQEYRFGGH